MRKLVFFLILSLFSSALLAVNLKNLNFPNYNKTGDLVWVSKTNPQNVIVIQELNNMWFELNENNLPQYLEKQSEVRSMINSFSGITDWQIEKADIVKTNKQNVLKMNGLYKAEKLTHFLIEAQLFKKPNIYQIKISSNAKNELSPTNTQEVLEIFYKELN